jgi:prophage DNA circulation protein
MRDWLSAFRPASFRGVPFFVDYEGAAGGRRVAISPIAYSSVHVTEDMGGEIRSVTLTAYVAGDAADANARSLIAALDVAGAATLILPMLAPLRVRALPWSLSRDKRRAGYVGFDLEFVAAGRSTVPFAQVPGRLAIAALLSDGAGLLSAAAVAGTRTITVGRASGLAAAVDAASASLAVIADASAVTGDDRVKVADLVRQMSTLNAEPVSAVAAITDITVEATRLICSASSAAPAADAFAAETTRPGNDAMSLVTSAVFAAGFCLALVSADYLSRQDARRARERISPTVDPVLEQIGSGLDVTVHEWLIEVAATAASDLSDTAANRAPLVMVRTERSLPATALAYVLYGDASRAAELVTRNASATPAFMPTAFEAISP